MSKPLSSEQKYEIIEKYNTGQYSCNDLALQYNLSGPGISSLLKRNGIVVINNRPILTQDKKDIILEKYITKKYSICELAEEENVGVKSVRKILRKNNIETNQYRKYSLNEHYFDIIDSEEKAYFLGLLYADGCNDTKRNSIVLQLQEEDKEILDKLLLALNYSDSLHFVNINKKFPNRKNAWRLALRSPHMSQQLAKLGCVPAKSLVLQFPTEEQVPSHLLQHFLRGLWDGDGSFSMFQSQEKWFLTSCLVSTETICNYLQLYLFKNLSIKIGIRTDKRCKSQTKYLMTQKMCDTLIFYKWLYHDSNIFLKRKYDKFLLHKDKLLELISNGRFRKSTRQLLTSILSDN